MKVRTLAIAAGVSAPLILSHPAAAGFVGTVCTIKQNDFGLVVINVFAAFDRPGEDRFLAAAGTPLSRNGVLDSCDIADGTSNDGNGDGIPDECDLACLDCAGGDGQVDVLDLLAVLEQWGQAGTPCDFGGNGVDLLDFLYLLANWGPCP